jgi:hypothetical protein
MCGHFGQKYTLLAVKKIFAAKTRQKTSVLAV